MLQKGRTIYSCKAFHSLSSTCSGSLRSLTQVEFNCNEAPVGASFLTVCKVWCSARGGGPGDANGRGGSAEESLARVSPDFIYELTSSEFYLAITFVQGPPQSEITANETGLLGHTQVQHDSHVLETNTLCVAECGTHRQKSKCHTE